jgi:SAM-dependent methyltransferase
MDLLEQTGQPAVRHPWEVARRDFFLEVLSREGVLDAARCALDVGAGDAYFAKGLRERMSPAARLTCWDANYSAPELSARSEALAGVTFTQGLEGGRYDLALMLDVVEHVEDDGGFLAEVVSHLEPGAAVLFSVPAWPELFTAHDVALRHYRRYRPRQARALLEAAGLRVRRSGGLFHSLFPVRALERVAQTLRPAPPKVVGVGRWRAGDRVTAAVNALLRGDATLSHLFARAGLEVPGLSWWALCERS